MVLQEIDKEDDNDQDFLMNDFDVWTHALRYLAIDLKQLIVYSCSASIYLKK